MPFEIRSEFRPTGDQPRAIAELTEGLRRRDRHQVLLGVTGSGKTFTVANVVSQVRRPTLVIAHNKTLAAQLYGEFKELFPDAAVHYFVSYYDYYQPEAYVPSSDTYIEKDSSINDEIDRMRHAATHALLTAVHRDTVKLQKVVVVDTPIDVALERLVKQRGFDRADAEARMRSQVSREERLKEADYVVDNSGDRSTLEAEVDKLWVWLLGAREELRTRAGPA